MNWRLARKSVIIRHGRAEAPSCPSAPRLRTQRCAILCTRDRTSLYGDAALIRAWRRIGSLGRQRLDLYASTTEASEALEAWLARKARRATRPSLPRSHSSPGANNHRHLLPRQRLAQRHRADPCRYWVDRRLCSYLPSGRLESLWLSPLTSHSSERQWGRFRDIGFDIGEEVRKQPFPEIEREGNAHRCLRSVRF